MSNVTQPSRDDNQAKSYIDRQQALVRALGQPLTQLLDRKQAKVLELQAISLELLSIDADIYQELVNLLQSQIGAVLGPIDTRVQTLEVGRGHGGD